jgi:O-acetylhomoserine (thiol)-lyase
LLPKGKGSMIAFGIKGGKKAGEVFLNNVKLASHLANVGDARTLVIHPASTTHSQMDEKTLTLAGIPQDLVRLSVGLEDIDDLKNDFNNAFRITKKTFE